MTAPEVHPVTHQSRRAPTNDNDVNHPTLLIVDPHLTRN